MFLGIGSSVEEGVAGWRLLLGSGLGGFKSISNLAFIISIHLMAACW